MRLCCPPFSIITEITVRLKIFKPISQCCLMRRTIYSTLVLLSALSLLIGSIALRLGNLVPDSLTGLTIFAIIILVTYGILLLYFEGSRFQFIGVILAIVSFLISSNTAHLNGLSNFYSSGYLEIADITMITGFYVFPAAYIVFWAKMDSILSKKNAGGWPYKPFNEIHAARSKSLDYCRISIRQI